MTDSLSSNRDCEIPDTFGDRMEVQCSHIRQYRLEVIRNEGRQLSYDEAALEWIERYAEVFAREHDNA